MIIKSKKLSPTLKALPKFYHKNIAFLSDKELRNFFYKSGKDWYLILPFLKKKCP